MKRNFALTALVAVGALSVTGYAGAATPEQLAAGKAKVAQVCQNCHGPEGDSISATFPRLNGQQADYIVSQLKGFRSHTRKDPHAMAYMWGMAAQMDDDTITSVAAYLASQKPTNVQRGGALSLQGQKIYLNGVETHNVPACAACHGPNGEGNSEIPRLAGQHADYLRKQMEDFRSLVRDNDVMHANTKDMTDTEIESVVSFLAND